MGSVRKLIRSEQGLAVVELAIILGLIIASAALAMLVVGNQSERTFALLTDWGTPSRQTVPAPSADATEWSVEIEASPEVTSRNTTVEAPMESWVPNTIEFRLDDKKLTVFFSCLALLGYCCTRGRQLAQAEEDDEEISQEFWESLDRKRVAKRQEMFRLLSHDPKAVFENRVEVRHLMTRQVQTAQARETVEELRRRVEREHVRHFPVVNNKEQIVGLVSDRDLLRNPGRTARDVMTRSLVTVSPTTKINLAVSQMLNRNISCLPVMQDGQLVGVLTTTDVMMALQCALHLLHRTSREKRAAEREEACPVA